MCRMFLLSRSRRAGSVPRLSGTAGSSPGNPEPQGDLETLLQLEPDTRPLQTAWRSPAWGLASMLHIYHLKKRHKATTQEPFGDSSSGLTTAGSRAPLSCVLLPVCKELPPCACKSCYQNEMTMIKNRAEMTERPLMSSGRGVGRSQRRRASAGCSGKAVGARAASTPVPPWATMPAPVPPAPYDTYPCTQRSQGRLLAGGSAGLLCLVRAGLRTRLLGSAASLRPVCRPRAGPSLARPGQGIP